MLWNQTVVVVAKFVNVFKKHEIAHFKWLNCQFSETHLNKEVFLITSDRCTKRGEDGLRVGPKDFGDWYCVRERKRAMETASRYPN